MPGDAFVLDACAVIAYLNAEPGGDRVKALIGDNRNRVLMHYINLGEVYYGFRRSEGEQKASDVLNKLLDLPVEYVTVVTLDLLKHAGKFKSEHRISYADAFVLALAETEQVQIVTSDHHEFDLVEAAGQMKFFWIR